VADEEVQIEQQDAPTLEDAGDSPVTFPAGPEDWVQSPDAEIQIEGVPVDESLVGPVVAPESEEGGEDVVTQD
jgi:hypothetical protein